MKIIENVKEASNYFLNKKVSGLKIGFVPTMGYLHLGHLSLIRLVKKYSDYVVVSIFVNPIQFGPNEDLDKYPKDIERDIKLLEQEGVDCLFLPSNEQMYNEKFSTNISLGDITKKLCGKYRDNHFDGVTTVVSKLFNIVFPDYVAFGKKDAQQLIIIKKMIDELNYSINVLEGEIIREDDGLAMSSRNKYLNNQERNVAKELNIALNKGKELIKNGEDRPEIIKNEIKNHLSKFNLLNPQYIDIVDIDKNLENSKIVSNNSLVALAVFVGTTRLIDNFFVKDIGEDNA